jgi:hypothetical protein
MTENLSDFDSEDNITLSAGKIPVADVVFLPTDISGTPGRLNSLILGQLNIDLIVIPKTFSESRLYEIIDVGGQLICFVVTVGPDKTSVLLESNLYLALQDKRIAHAESIWIPLLGTGTGQLSLDSSRSLIVSALTRGQWRRRRGVRITLSFPPNGLVKSDVLAGFNVDESVLAVFNYAASLRIGYKDDDAAISTTLLFFSLASSQRLAAPVELRDSLAALLFSGAVHSLAGSNYVKVWSEYYPNYDKPSSVEDTYFWPASASFNVRTVLRTASGLAHAAGRAVVALHDVIFALVSHEKGRHRVCIERMGISINVLREQLRDALGGEIGRSLFNDVAAINDKLGYDSYATAIRDFIVDVDTPPPLSISIQAPWGAGKSSLMQQIRNKLDPLRARNKNKQVGSEASEDRMKIRDALAFLNQKKEDLKHEQPEPRQLWTVWFNAWKYDTSEQVWAGLVDAIVSQISERLKPYDRELFLFRLQLARIDDGIVRRKIYDRIVTVWWQKVRGWTLGGVALIASSMGVHRAATALWTVPEWSIKFLAGLPAGLGISLAILLACMYKSTEQETKEEKASFSLAEYLQVPDYDRSLGTIHHIHRDLLRVLSLTPKISGADMSTPIVIFVDDLDRCSPSKIASVVEGVSMFLASEEYRCMFVIGMDPQMIAAALEEAHAKVRERLPSYERAVPLGWRFMDKFIQLPFTIPPTGWEALTAYMDALTGANAEAAGEDSPVPGGQRTDRVEDPTPSPEDPRKPSGVAGNGRDEQHVRRAESIVGKGEEDPDEPGVIPEAVKKFRESRDVGELIRQAAGKMSGNPREIKRLANLARLYLGLRNVRRGRQMSWRSPDISQYARWITLTLRWPDMMRWLQWGADESSTSSELASNDLTERRLRALCDAARDSATIAEWKATLTASMGLSCENGNEPQSDWTGDPKLLEFFKAEALLEDDRTLHAAIRGGFW